MNEVAIYFYGFLIIISIVFCVSNIIYGKMELVKNHD